jgi:hypothetical protein
MVRADTHIVDMRRAEHAVVEGMYNARVTMWEVVCVKKFLPSEEETYKNEFSCRREIHKII